MRFLRPLMPLVGLIVVINTCQGSITFMEQPRDAIVPPGSAVTFSCRAVSSCGPIGYTWRKNDTTSVLKPLSDSKVSVVGIRQSTSVVCIATCRVGAVASRAAIVRVAYFSTGAVTGESRKVIEFSSLLLQTPAIKSFPTAQFTWKKSQRGMLQNISSQSYSASDSSLFFATVRRSDIDNATYLLYARNPILGNGTYSLVKTFQLVIERDDTSQGACPNRTFVNVRPLKNVTAVAGSTVTVDCLVAMVKCSYALAFTWTFEGRQVSASPRLTLAPLTKASQGNYVCAVQGLRSTFTQKMHVAVIEKPRFIQVGRSPIVVKRSHMIFIGSGKVDNYVDVKWFFNGNQVTYGRKIILYHANWLVVRNAADDDAGLYQIVYSNQAGSVSAVVNVIVEPEIVASTSLPSLLMSSSRILPSSFMLSSLSTTSSANRHISIHSSPSMSRCSVSMSMTSLSYNANSIMSSAILLQPVSTRKDKDGQGGNGAILGVGIVLLLVLLVVAFIVIFLCKRKKRAYKTAANHGNARASYKQGSQGNGQQQNEGFQMEGNSRCSAAFDGEYLVPVNEYALPPLPPEQQPPTSPAGTPSTTPQGRRRGMEPSPTEPTLSQRQSEFISRPCPDLPPSDDTPVYACVADSAGNTLAGAWKPKPKPRADQRAPSSVASQGAYPVDMPTYHCLVVEPPLDASQESDASPSSNNSEYQTAHVEHKESEYETLQESTRYATLRDIEPAKDEYHALTINRPKATADTK